AAVLDRQPRIFTHDRRARHGHRQHHPLLALRRVDGGVHRARHRGLSDGGAVMAFSEERETLWVLAAGPFIWLAHFMASYIFAAVWCEKVAGRDGSLMPARLTIGAFTLFALLGLFYLGLR